MALHGRRSVVIQTSKKGGSMGSHNRDWYRHWWAKKTGYVERSSFRLGEGDKARIRDRSAWRRNVWLVVLVALAIVVLALFR